MGKFKDLSGMQFGQLSVIKISHRNKNGKIVYECNCSCGKENLLIIGTHLTSGNTKSCGCLQKKIVKKIGKNNKQYNKYDLSGEYGIGWTNNTNTEFYFDLEDYEKIKNFCWRNNDDDYILTHDSKSNNYSNIWIHRLILNVDQEDIEIDHKNHNKRDNRKENLRISIHSKNGKNKGLFKNNKSSTSDVCWHKASQKWQARICVDNKRIYLGCFADLNEAIKVRKEAEQKYFGEYSYDNSIKAVNN